MKKSNSKIATSFYMYLAEAGTRLPRRVATSRLVALLVEVHARNGGASVHPRFGNLQGQSLFAVSLFPERTVRINGRNVPPEIIPAFIRQNTDLLINPRVIIGTWYNVEEDTTYLDVTAVCSDREQAMRLGEEYNQIAIYDLAHEVEISLGGTGEDILEALPEVSRLPPLERL